MHRRFLSACLATLVSVVGAGSAVFAESITVATYNVENFRTHFSARVLATQPSVKQNPELKDFVDQLRRENEEDNWEVSLVLTDPAFNPDVVVLQECANQSDLEYFNRRWLAGMYQTVIQFPSNTTRDQHLAIMLKPGFKVVEQRTDYHKIPDSVPNDRGNFLFARGPSFVLIETPAGFKMWVGTTHQKSKGGNSVEVTEWRNREAVATHKIMRELKTTGHPVLLLGDFNDEIGIQEFEQEGGGDVVANLVGPDEAGFLLLTEPLSRAGKISFGGYAREDYRSFIDHIVATSDLKNRIEKVDVYQDGVARVASDHYPVYVRLKTAD